MRTIVTADFRSQIASASVITIGNFDGVHRGHREIFRTVCQYALEDSLQSLVVTFDPHPLQMLSPERAPMLITNAEQKRSLIAESDIDTLIVIPFDLAFSRIPADHFVRDILVRALGMKRLVIGHDYAFGRNREGNEALLARLSVEYGFKLDVMEPVGDGGLIFSSSEVRRLVSRGDMDSASRLLGRCHRITGSVVPGREIGRSIGFPTANVGTDNQLIPADGVYAVWVEVMGEIHMAASSIGVNPTFGESTRTIEVFLFDFDSDLYGKELTIHFMSRLRDIARFVSVDALKSQISKDVSAARDILSSSLLSEVMS